MPFTLHFEHIWTFSERAKATQFGRNYAADSGSDPVDLQDGLPCAS
jgi:hypothetical protein